eukprot:2191620-Amphidinium_carterae.2
MELLARTAATPNPMAAPNLAAANPLGAAANPLGAAANPLGANPMAANPFMAMMGQMGQQQQQPAAFPTCASNDRPHCAS